MSQNLRRWLVAGVMLLGLVPFVGMSVLPFFSSGDTAQPVTQETVSPTPSATTATQVSPAAKQEELKAQVRGYEAILQQEPDNQTALMGLLLTREQLVQMGAADIQEMLAPLEKLASLNPSDVSLQSALGRVYAQQKRYDDAIAIYDRLIQTNQQDYQLVLDKAVVLRLQGKKDEAKALFAKAADLAPTGVKEQIQAQIQQLDAAPAPTGSAAKTPNSGTPATPATTAPAATQAPTKQVPAQPPATTPAATKTPSSEVPAKPAVPTPAATPNSPASDAQTAPVAPTPVTSPSP